ncbi:MAG: MFS transporter [Eubacteriaceae bacterium]
MIKENKKNIILIFALLLMIPAAMNYVWSILQPYIMTYFSIDSASASVPAMINMGIFPIGNILSGKMQQKISVTKILAASCAAGVCSILIISALPPSAYLLFTVLYGVIFSLCCGVIYNAILSTAQKWFYYKLGSVTGLLLCMIGISGFSLSPLCSSLLLKTGLSSTFLILGIVFAVIYTPAIFVIKSPPEGYIKSHSTSGNEKIMQYDYTVKEMVKTRYYYLITLSFMFAVPAFALINPIFVITGLERSITYQQAIAGVMFASLAQSGGRLVLPWLSDKIKREPALLLTFIICAAAVIMLAFAKGTLFILLFMILAFSYGGFMGQYPAVSTHYFGIKNAGLNYGIVMLGFSVAAILSPFLAKAVLKTQMGTSLSFLIAGCACAVGMTLIIILYKSSLKSSIKETQ